MTYRSYLDSFAYPFRCGRGADAEAYNGEAKALRQAKKRKFTEPGEPGHMFRCSPSLVVAGHPQMCLLLLGARSSRACAHPAHHDSQLLLSALPRRKRLLR